MPKAKSPLKTRRFEFDALLEKPDKDGDMAFISMPFSAEKEYGTRGQVKVKATFDGHAYRGVIANMGSGCHIIGVRKDIRQAIGKQVGDRVHVTIEKDEEERVVDMPEELVQLLAKNATAGAFYRSLSFTNRKEYAVWIQSAKKEETKVRRVKDTLAKLLAGKKNPSEK